MRLIDQLFGQPYRISETLDAYANQQELLLKELYEVLEKLHQISVAIENSMDKPLPERLEAEFDDISGLLLGLLDRREIKASPLFEADTFGKIVDEEGIELSESTDLKDFWRWYTQRRIEGTLRDIVAWLIESVSYRRISDSLRDSLLKWQKASRRPSTRYSVEQNLRLK